MSDESKAKAMSEHAVVKQEHTTLADEILFKSGCVSSGSRNPEKLAQLLADHDAEVERKKDAYIAALYGEIHRQITNALECFEQHDTQNGIRKLKVMLRAEPRFHEKEALAEVERRLLRNFLSDSISHDEHVHGVRDSCWLCNTLGGTNG